MKKTRKTKRVPWLKLMPGFRAAVQKLTPAQRRAWGLRSAR